MQTDNGDAAIEVWDIVRRDFADSSQFVEDQARIAAALAARRMDSRTFFGRMHTQWDALRTQLFGSDFALTTLLSFLPDDVVIADLGCGTGEALAWLAPVVGRVIGVDLEQGMLDAAAERLGELPNVDLRHGGLESLPLEDAEADAVLVMLVLHHVHDLELAFAELYRVMKPGGKAVILDMHAHDREDYRIAMGHAHLGFDTQHLADLAIEAGLQPRNCRDLPPQADANGPPLFVLTLTRPQIHGR